MPQLSIEISAIYISLLALLMLSLALRVVKMRLRHKIGIGDGNNPELQLAIRTHANTTEYVPIALFVLIALESTWQLPWLTHLMGSALFLGRSLHAIGLGRSSGASKPRFFGTLITWLMVITSSIAVLVHRLI